MDVRRVHDIPADLPTGFERYDYFDLWVAGTTGAMSQTPEHWAGATMEGASRVGRFLAWQTVLGLRMAAGPGTVAGWRIIEHSDRSIVLETRSWFMTAHAVFHIAPGQVWFGLFVTYGRPVGKILWGATMSAVHRSLTPRFLWSGVERGERR